MPSDFLVDLIDHKRRVGLYMQKFTEKLFQKAIEQDYTINRDEMSLIDIARLFFRQEEEVDLDTQMYKIMLNTREILRGKITINNQQILHFITCELFKRAVVHDNSKFSPEEYEPYEEAFPGLQKYAYGTDEFKAELRKIKPAIQHHYENNDHHPERFMSPISSGIEYMNLIQIIEMTCDWIAASERSQKDIFEGLEMNKERFKISDQLHGIIKNTVITLKEEQ
jgi:hypothetical protein